MFLPFFSPYPGFRLPFYHLEAIEALKCLPLLPLYAPCWIYRVNALLPFTPLLGRKVLSFTPLSALTFFTILTLRSPRRVYHFTILAPYRVYRFLTIFPIYGPNGVNIFRHFSRYPVCRLPFFTTLSP